MISGDPSRVASGISTMASPIPVFHSGMPISSIIRPIITARCGARHPRIMGICSILASTVERISLPCLWSRIVPRRVSIRRAGSERTILAVAAKSH
jgi:uncharacterized membrane protein